MSERVMTPRVWKRLRIGRLGIVIDRPWPDRYGLAGITFQWWPR